MTAEMQLALSCVTIALGCVLLGLQVDASGAMVGTGRTALAIGIVVSLVAMLIRSARTHAAHEAPWLPRDLVTVLGVVTGFFGLACVVGGVLAPGGGWMFFEVVLLVLLLALSHRRGQGMAPELGTGAITVLALLLIFRVWVTYQGSEHRWALISIDVPILSGLPLEFLDPVRKVSLGSFTPDELGFPPAGIDFHVSMTLWALGFVLCIAGLKWGAHAVREHESDRIHTAIHDLPPQLAMLVEKILPEEDWEQLGLHGLSDRRLRKRIESLVGERLAARREIEAALRSASLLSMTSPGGFAGEVYSALVRQEALPPAKEDEE
jgi:hypothetical protein